MKNKYLKNSIISLMLVIITILAPITLIPKKIEAQNVTGSIKGIVPMIAQLPQCIILGASVILELFPGLAKKIVDRAIRKGTAAGQVFLKTASLDSAWLILGVPVNLQPSVLYNLQLIANDTTAGKEAMKTQMINDTCLRSIGKLVAKMLLQKITISTVNWINNGYDGAPMFIQNPGSFFKDIAKNEILQFNLDIQNPELFPFGKQWMQNQANAFKKKFNDNAQYSLNDLIKKTTPEFGATEFGADFSKGGWNAWDYMTQVPANNPYGFGLMASRELDLRLSGTLKSVADELRDSLKEAAGFLGMEKCADPKGLTREQHNEALNEESNYANVVSRGGGDANLMGVNQNLCKRWEYVTPGAMIAESANITLGTTENSLISTDDLNGAIAAVLDAILNKFTSDLFSKGFSELSYEQEAREGGFIYNSSDLENYDGSSDFDGYDSTFLRQNKGFNIRRDLSQAIVDEQRIFIDKIIQQNTELNSTTDGRPYKESEESYNGTTNAYGLIPTLYQLDYCIPGPHSGWENHSKRVLQEILNTISPETQASAKEKGFSDLGSLVKANMAVISNKIPKTIEEILGSTTPITKRYLIVNKDDIDVKLSELLRFVYSNFFAQSRAKGIEVRGFYSLFTSIFTDLNIDATKLPKNNDLANNLQDKQAFSQAMNDILDDYILLVNNTYKATLMPSITAEAKSEYELQRGYVEIYKSNIDRISSMKGVVARLNIIKSKVEKLNEEFSPFDKDGNPKPQTIKDQGGRIVPLENKVDTMGNIIQLGQQGQYEENLKPLIYEFGRLSSEMVTGDDIAVVDNRTKEIIDKKNYVYKTLIKGVSGCERQLYYNEGSGIDGGLPWQILATKRPIYPAEILYNYNRYTKGGELPDPFGSGAENKMPEANTTNTVGPGFLSWANFSNNENSCSSLSLNPNYIGCIDTSKYFPLLPFGAQVVADDPCDRFMELNCGGESTIQGSGNGAITTEDDTKKITPIGRRNSGGKMIPNTSAGIFESIIGVF